jgi:hypothetical protein
VFEGADGGNVSSLRTMAGASKNALLHFHLVPGADHFSVLAPVNETIAAQILSDKGPTANLSFADVELK